MKDNNVSRTAEIVAAMRAKHTMYDQPVVFEDPYAIDFCNKQWQAMLCAGILPWKVMDRVARGMQSIALEVVGRARYTEDLLDLAISKGVTQYVILGAGFDSFCLRRPDLASSLSVFEVDFPSTQTAKRQQMLKNYGALPSNLHFVHVDFEQETLADGLARSDFDPSEGTFFSWLGTTMYLSHAAVTSTLRSLVSYTASNSELVFDYYTAPKLMVALLALPRAQRFVTRIARQGEPFIGFYQPEEISELLSSNGLRLLENFSPQRQNKRYFEHRSDTAKTFRRGYFAHALVE
ncbi:MAG: methyltransferase (TIGR00027 family) [Arenicella sp.]|jgi:methyltransferase (TIGR00027 family)